jgi:hypothetical protein
MANILKLAIKLADKHNWNYEIDGTGLVFDNLIENQITFSYKGGEVNGKSFDITLYFYSKPKDTFLIPSNNLSKSELLSNGNVETTYYDTNNIEELLETAGPSLHDLEMYFFAPYLQTIKK